MNVNAHRCKEFHRLDNTNLELKFGITAKVHNLGPHPIPSHTTVNFKSLPHPFIATHLSLFVGDHPPFRLLHDSITFLNTLTFLKYIAQFQPCLFFLFALSPTSSFAFSKLHSQPPHPLIMLILMTLIFPIFWFPNMNAPNNTI